MSFVLVWNYSGGPIEVMVSHLQTASEKLSWNRMGHNDYLTWRRPEGTWETVIFRLPGDDSRREGRYIKIGDIPHIMFTSLDEIRLLGTGRLKEMAAGDKGHPELTDSQRLILEKVVNSEHTYASE